MSKYFSLGSLPATTRNRLQHRHGFWPCLLVYASFSSFSYASSSYYNYDYYSSSSTSYSSSWSCTLHHSNSTTRNSPTVQTHQLPFQRPTPGSQHRATRVNQKLPQTIQGIVAWVLTLWTQAWLVEIKWDKWLVGDWRMVLGPILAAFQVRVLWSVGTALTAKPYQVTIDWGAKQPLQKNAQPDQLPDSCCCNNRNGKLASIFCRL